VTEQPRKSKDDIAREQLVPLAEGERPVAVTVAAAVALAIALTNVVLVVAGVEVEGSSRGGALFFAGLMLLAAYGLWRARYWAVLGFQALLAIVLLITGLSLFVASNAWAALIEVAVIIAAGTLFWFMVRALARIQMPERRPRSD
jgi:hypothetical protein